MGQEAEKNPWSFRGRLVLPIVIFGILGLASLLHLAQADHQADMQYMYMSETDDNSTEFTKIPCSTTSQCQNDTDGLGPLSFCDPAKNECKCQAAQREIQIRQHQNYCVVPLQLDSKCQNDHECGAGTPHSICLKTRCSITNEDIFVCKCDSNSKFSESKKVCIPKSVSIPSPNRWWFVLLIVGYPLITIIFSVTRQHIFKSFRKRFCKNQKRRSSSGTSIGEESNSTDEESEIEMGTCH